MKKVIFLTTIIIILVISVNMAYAEPFSPEKNYYIYYYRASTDYYLWVESNREFYINWDENKISSFDSLEEAQEWDNWIGQLIVYSKSGESGDWVRYSVDANVASFDETCTIIESNANVYDLNGNIVYGEQEQIQADIDILLPADDGFQDNSWMFNFWVQTRFDRKVMPESLNIEIEVYDEEENIVEGFESDVTYNELFDVSTYTVHYLRFWIEVPYGVHKVKIKYMYNGEEIAYAERIVERLSGFVDEDGDGKDDRTGNEDNNKKIIEYDPELNLDGSVNGMVKFLKSSVEGIRTVANVIAVTFSFLPKQVINAFTGIIMVAIVIGIWRLIRG